MKRILLIICTLLAALATIAMYCAPVFAEDFGPDTAAHFAISGAAGFAASAVLTDATDLAPWTRRTLAFSAAMAPGVYKEVGMDEEVSTTDLMADATGAAIFVFVGEKFAVWAHPRPMTRTDDVRRLVSR